jgi:DNA (cytosine-5)-methyltransferase 1
VTEEFSPTLQAQNNGSTAVPAVLAFKAGQSEAAGGTFVTEEFSPTLQAQNNGSTAVPAILQTSAMSVRAAEAVDVKQVQWASGGGKMENDTAQTLRSGAEHNYQFARINTQVRRLTPRECERLQGFPDDWTLIPYRKGQSSDSNRYRALGNSMAVPCMFWIGARIAQVDGAVEARDTP